VLSLFDFNAVRASIAYYYYYYFMRNMFLNECYIVYFYNDNVISLSKSWLQVFGHVTPWQLVIIADASNDRCAFVFRVQQSKKSVVHCHSSFSPNITFMFQVIHRQVSIPTER
jgi:hypothetical protein